MSQLVKSVAQLGGANCSELRVTTAWANLNDTFRSSQPSEGVCSNFLQHIWVKLRLCMSSDYTDQFSILGHAAKKYS